ncbi:hypothetical protein L2E82_20729 [Cichorium intybus]|uniref:Uncharacterized protein n=1 Tax=Cichorium intybus TaxID=13427 RepID=A0ACB9DTU4_CICIN|nr:hypothetical protein L2E82_20729 [Cichorium intybus]
MDDNVDSSKINKILGECDNKDKQIVDDDQNGSLTVPGASQFEGDESRVAIVEPDFDERVVPSPSTNVLKKIPLVALVLSSSLLTRGKYTTASSPFG